jgi:hypothetical protein
VLHVNSMDAAGARSILRRRAATENQNDNAFGLSFSFSFSFRFSYFDADVSGDLTERVEADSRAGSKAGPVRPSSRGGQAENTGWTVAAVTERT